jgi:hypothetical protein
MADKLVVLSFFRSHPDTWAADIVSAVGHVADRTLRNWLRELVEDGSIESRGERKGRRYHLCAHSVIPGTGQLALAGQPPIVQSIFSPHIQQSQISSSDLI